MAITKKIAERLQTGLKRFQPILSAQRDRDVSEADTVTLVKDLLSEAFGYDKYAELTSEHAIRGTYCDLAIQFDGKVQLLIEVKAIGSGLQERHVKQSIDYASNSGVEWVVLTNGIEWVLFHVLFQKPIAKEEIVRLNLLEMDARRSEDLERLYLLTRAGLTKDALTVFRDRQHAVNRFLLSAIILNSDTVLACIRREVRRVSGILVDASAVQKVLREQVLKRETLEGEQADAEGKRFNRRAIRTHARRTGDGRQPEEPCAGSKEDGPADGPEAARDPAEG